MCYLTWSLINVDLILWSALVALLLVSWSGTVRAKIVPLLLQQKTKTAVFKA
jgi:hypothetical protein